MLMELEDMSSVSMPERPSLLYIIRLETNASYTAVSSWISHKNQRLWSDEFVFVAQRVVGLTCQGTSLAMIRAAEVAISSILLRN
jgi:hypothetical protein